MPPTEATPLPPQRRRQPPKLRRPSPARTRRVTRQVQHARCGAAADPRDPRRPRRRPAGGVHQVGAAAHLTGSAGQSARRELPLQDRPAPVIVPPVPRRTQRPDPPSVLLHQLRPVVASVDVLVCPVGELVGQEPSRSASSRRATFLGSCRGSLVLGRFSGDNHLRPERG